MAGRYIPPHMRNKDPASPKPPPKARTPTDGYSIAEICHQFDFRKDKASTLNGLPVRKGSDDNSVVRAAGEKNDSEPATAGGLKPTEAVEAEDAKNGGRRPLELKFILLFKDQHPAWPPTIFCKSHLNLLSTITPATITADNWVVVDNDHDQHKPPISVPVFSQNRPPSLTTSSPPPPSNARLHRDQPFYFWGNYIIKETKRLAPGSEELVAMLETKFGGMRKRREEDWKRSLGLEWAVVELVRVDGDEGKDDDNNPMVPLKLVSEPKEVKSVTEMLASLRAGEDAASSSSQSQQWAAMEGKANA